MLLLLIGGGIAAAVGWTVFSAKGKPAAEDDDLLAVMASAPQPSAPSIHTSDGLTLALRTGDTTLGRSAECDLVLGDESTSRLHARIRSESGASWIHDEASTGGTWVNGVRVTNAPLHDGDVVRLGTYEFVFRAASKGSEN